MPTLTLAHTLVIGWLCLSWAGIAAGQAEAARPPVSPSPAQTSAPDAVAAHRELLDRYCVTCHNARLRTADLALTAEALDLSDVGVAPDVWEQVVYKLRGDLMPPAGRPRPDRARSDAFRHWLQAELDQAAATNPDPGRVPTHRLNRTEYANAIRDLLALEVDSTALLPGDDTGHGFDNLAGTLSLSPALMEGYLSAARRISRLAVGDPSIPPSFTTRTYTNPTTLRQNDRMSEDLPFGSRGGLAVRHHFPLDGDYVIRIRLTRSVYEYIVNLDETHQLDVRVDGRPVAQFPVGGAQPGKPAPVSFSGTFVAAGGAGYPTQAWDDYRTAADAGLEIWFTAKAGTRVVGVSFVGQSWEGEGVSQPPLREYGATVTETTDTSSRPEGPGVGSVTIDGPYDATGPGSTRSRARIFLCRPTRPADEVTCARSIFATLARRAYRRPVTDADLEPLLPFFESGRDRGGFDGGIRAALERILIDPEFLFRIERDPTGVVPGTIYPLGDLELASRLSFFLWSSIPDDELIDLAARGELSHPATLERQVRRLLSDARSAALIDNFASQWLSLRSVRGLAPDPNLFPEFDENLRRAFEQETTLFLRSQLRDDRAVTELLEADYTFLNERLAGHYAIPGVRGSRFRRVPLDNDRRMGILGHGSILAVTSYGNRTSPVLRAKWLLDNVLGAPPPPPPADVPALPGENETGTPRSVRERLAQHRRSPACAACHATMDPLGFALENFDAVGKWRATDAGAPIDASALLADGTTSFRGPGGLRELLLSRSDQFVETVTEKLLIYALGRGLEFYDRPVVRKIARDAADDHHRWSSLILGIVRSAPFQMRRSES